MNESRATMESIVAQLKTELVQGHYPPGSRFPSCRVLCARLHASHVTMHKALRRLCDEGFLQSRDRSHLAVAAAPPHLAAIGLLWQGHPAERTSLFYKSLAKAIQTFNKHHPDGPRLVEYGRPGRVTPNDPERLLKDVEARKLGGVLLTPSTLSLKDTALDPARGFPSVAISSGHALGFILFDFRSFYRQALEDLTTRRCRRPLFLLTSLAPHELASGMIADAVQEAALALDPAMIQAIPADNPGWCQSLAHLIHALPLHRRPDSLVIADDNLIRPTLAMWTTLGMNVPTVAHINYPCVPRLPPQIRQIGFNIERLTEEAVRLIDGMRHTAKPQEIALPAERFT